jgi:hypothetical protein
MERLLGADGVTLTRYESDDEVTVVAQSGAGAPVAPAGTRLSLADTTWRPGAPHSTGGPYGGLRGQPWCDRGADPRQGRALRRRRSDRGGGGSSGERRSRSGAASTRRRATPRSGWCSSPSYSARRSQTRTAASS